MFQQFYSLEKSAAFNYNCLKLYLALKEESGRAKVENACFNDFMRGTSLCLFLMISWLILLALLTLHPYIRMLF